MASSAAPCRAALLLAHALCPVFGTHLGPGSGEWFQTKPDWPAPEKLRDGVGKLWREYPGRRCLLVVHNGMIAYEGYARGAGPWERLESDSQAKTINALLIGVLVTQGKLDLDTPLRHYNVTPSAHWGPYWPLITTRHLLTHTSGLGKQPPGQKFEYNSGAHIQHLSALIRKLTSPPNGVWKDPISWAEEFFLRPMGLSGLYNNDGLDGDISIGGGQLVSCRDMARVGQLMLNKGRWPCTDKFWQGALWRWLPWHGDDFTQLVSEDFLYQMTRPSFPDVASTYGFLTWLNRAPEPGDSTCCMCTCGVCVGVADPPILGTVVEEVWMATGYLSKYLMVLPQRNASIVSIGMDMAGSQACSVAMSWASLTYDDTFGCLLHYNILEDALPRPDSSTTSSTTTTTTTTTSSTTATTTTTTSTTVTTTSTSPWAPIPVAAESSPSTTTTSTTSTTTATATSMTTTTSGTTTSTTTTTTARSTSTSASGARPQVALAANASSVTSTTSFNPLAHIYHGGYSNEKPGLKNAMHRNKTGRHASRRRRSEGYYQGGSCTCSCPIDEDFGRCFDLPKELTFNHWHEGSEACLHFSQSYEHLSELLGGFAGCWDVGLVQHCKTNEWYMTSDLCSGTTWFDGYGMQCERVASCGGDAAHPPIPSAIGSMETCLCKAVRWSCMYDYEPCDSSDAYYPRAPLDVSTVILKSRLEKTKSSVDMMLRVKLVCVCAAALLLVIFLCRLCCWCCRWRWRSSAARAGIMQGDYVRMVD